MPSSASRARVATELDLDACAKLQTSCFYDPVFGHGKMWTVFDDVLYHAFAKDVRATLGQKYEPHAKLGRFASLVVDASDEIVAVAEVSIQRSSECARAIERLTGVRRESREYCYLSCMCVDERFRGRGLASRLVAAGERVARDWGFDVLTLHVYIENIRALNVYERAGFVAIDFPARTPYDVVRGRSKAFMAKRL